MRLVLLNGGYCSDPRPRGSATWAHARRDRSVTAARARRKCRRRGQPSSVATQHRPTNHLDPRVCWTMRRWLLPFTPPNAGNRFGSVRRYRQLKRPEQRVSASFRSSRSSGAYRLMRAPHRALPRSLRGPHLGRRLDIPHGASTWYSWTEPDSAGTGVTWVTSSGTQPRHPDADATPGRTPPAPPGSDRPDTPDGCRPLGRKRQSSPRTNA